MHYALILAGGIEKKRTGVDISFALQRSLISAAPEPGEYELLLVCYGFHCSESAWRRSYKSSRVHVPGVAGGVRARCKLD